MLGAAGNHNACATDCRAVYPLEVRRDRRRTHAQRQLIKAVEQEYQPTFLEIAPKRPGMPRQMTPSEMRGREFLNVLGSFEIPQLNEDRCERLLPVKSTSDLSEKK